MLKIATAAAFVAAKINAVELEDMEQDMVELEDMEQDMVELEDMAQDTEEVQIEDEVEIEDEEAKNLIGNVAQPVKEARIAVAVPSKEKGMAVLVTGKVTNFAMHSVPANALQVGPAPAPKKPADPRDKILGVWSQWGRGQIHNLGVGRYSFWWLRDRSICFYINAKDEDKRMVAQKATKPGRGLGMKKRPFFQKGGKWFLNKYKNGKERKGAQKVFYEKDGVQHMDNKNGNRHWDMVKVGEMGPGKTAQERCNNFIPFEKYAKLAATPVGKPLNSGKWK